MKLLKAHKREVSVLFSERQGEWYQRWEGGEEYKGCGKVMELCNKKGGGGRERAKENLRDISNFCKIK